MKLSKSHKKILKKLCVNYGFTDKEKSLLSQHEIEFLYRRIRKT